MYDIIDLANRYCTNYRIIDLSIRYSILYDIIDSDLLIWYSTMSDIIDLVIRYCTNYCIWSSLWGGWGPEQCRPQALFPAPPHSTAWGGVSVSAFPAPVPAQASATPISQMGPR